MIRDAALRVAGTLNPQMGGRPVRIPIEPEVYDLIFTECERDGLWPVNPDKHVQNRRGIYLYNKRSVRLPLLVGVRPAGRDHVLPGAPGVDARAAGAVAVQFRASCRRSRTTSRRGWRRTCGSDRSCQIDTAWQLALARAAASSGDRSWRASFFRPAARCRISVWRCSIETSFSMSRRVPYPIRPSRAATFWSAPRTASAPSRWRRCSLRAEAAAQRVNPLAAKPPHLPGEGEIGHLPLHGRRAQPDRHVRPQAGAREVQRPAAAGELRHHRQPVHEGRHAAAAESLEVQEVRPVRARRFDAVSRTSRSAWTTCASSAASTPTAPCTRPRCTRSTPAAS